jgi:hypothetical protein
MDLNHLDSLVIGRKFNLMKASLKLTAAFALGFAVSAIAQQSPKPKPNENPSSQPAQVSFSPEGKLSVTNIGDKTVRIWDTRTAQPLTYVGTWQLVSYKYGDAADWSEPPQNQKRLKHITDTYFTWIAYDPASGKMQSMAGGPYTLKGDAYTETIEYAEQGMADYLGKKQTFTIQLESDKLHQSGQLSDGLKIEEIWKRVK